MREVLILPSTSWQDSKKASFQSHCQTIQVICTEQEVTSSDQYFESEETKECYFSGKPKTTAPAFWQVSLLRGFVSVLYAWRHFSIKLYGFAISWRSVKYRKHITWHRPNLTKSSPVLQITLQAAKSIHKFPISFDYFDDRWLHFPCGIHKFSFISKMLWVGNSAQTIHARSLSKSVKTCEFLLSLYVFLPRSHTLRPLSSLPPASHSHCPSFCAAGFPLGMQCYFRRQ